MSHGHQDLVLSLHFAFIVISRLFCHCLSVDHLDNRTTNLTSCLAMMVATYMFSHFFNQSQVGPMRYRTIKRYLVLLAIADYWFYRFIVVAQLICLCHVRCTDGSSVYAQMVNVRLKVKPRLWWKPFKAYPNDVNRFLRTPLKGFPLLIDYNL